MVLDREVTCEKSGGSFSTLAECRFIQATTLMNPKAAQVYYQATWVDALMIIQGVSLES